MKTKIGRFGTVLTAGLLALGTSTMLGAQQAPPASQMPEEIPVSAQYPPGQPPYDPPAQQGTQPDQAQANDAGAGRISYIHGDVSTQHSDSSDWAAATLNTPVVNGDHISTGPDGRTEIELDHANIVRLSDQTTANVVSLARNQIQLQIGQGLANYDILKDNESNVEIDTPNVAVRPEMGEGSYRIQVNSDGETIVDVRKGSAEISTPQGSTRVDRDQRITIQGTADNAQYQISGAPGRDDWDRWNSDRDRTIENAQSWRNTNPYYTGTQDLDAYGHWSDVPDYGPVWFPSAGPDWAPYRDGRWVWEPYYGWTWVSYEAWGWAPYHYGRWFVWGGNWGWWPGPVYVGYHPIWAPAYVSFFGYGGGGWSFGVGFGFGGGFGSVGWLPCGPGDRFFPWWGRGVTRVNEVNVYNIHGHEGGFAPLRGGPHAFSNLERAQSDEHVRAGFSSMERGQFGRERVPMHQSRIDAGTFRRASVMTGASPVSPSRQSFQSSDRQVNPRSIPNRPASSQRFFSSSARSHTIFRGEVNNAGRGGNSGNPAANGPRPGSSGFGPSNNGNVNRGSAPNSVQSSRPGWRTFRPPLGRQMQPNQPRQEMQSNGGRTFAPQGQSRPNFSQPSQSRPEMQPNGGRTFESQGQSRPNFSQPGQPRPEMQPNRGRTFGSQGPSRPNFSQPGQPRPEMQPNGGKTFESQGQPRPQMQNYPRGGYGYPNTGSNRPTLNMRQPVVTPRGQSSSPSRGPSYGGYRGGPSGGGSRGGNSGGSRGGSSGGGHGDR